jgi:molybdopterin-guanine dinucleotide biosynthesis protein B
MHELRGEPEATIERLLTHLTPVDLLLIEGFKHHEHPKLEVFRRAVGKTLLALGDPYVVAVASDGPVPEVKLPVIDLNDTGAVADFILRHCGFGARAGRDLA